MTGVRFALVAAALLGLLVAQIAGAVRASGGPEANSSASVAQQIKKLKKRVAAGGEGNTDLAAAERSGGR
jgi:hypothetical protein